jgi:hypothetical protein
MVQPNGPGERTRPGRNGGRPHRPSAIGYRLLPGGRRFCGAEARLVAGDRSGTKTPRSRRRGIASPKIRIANLLPMGYDDFGNGVCRPA